MTKYKKTNGSNHEAKEEQQLSQRTWDRVVGWGKTQPPSKVNKKDDKNRL